MTPRLTVAIILPYAGSGAFSCALRRFRRLEQAFDLRAVSGPQGNRQNPRRLRTRRPSCPPAARPLPGRRPRRVRSRCSSADRRRARRFRDRWSALQWGQASTHASRFVHRAASVSETVTETRSATVGSQPMASSSIRRFGHIVLRVRPWGTKLANSNPSLRLRRACARAFSRRSTNSCSTSELRRRRLPVAMSPTSPTRFSNALRRSTPTGFARSLIRFSFSGIVSW